MNLIEGAIVRDDRGAGIDSPDLRIRLPESLLARHALSGAERCALGVRPEHITVGAPGEGECDVNIDVVENIGAEYLCYAFRESGQIVVRSPRRIDQGRVSLRFDWDRARLFPL
jgi:ABC-type sugar transport system ATPase subunit